MHKEIGSLLSPSQKLVRRIVRDQALNKVDRFQLEVDRLVQEVTSHRDKLHLLHKLQHLKPPHHHQHQLKTNDAKFTNYHQ